MTNISDIDAARRQAELNVTVFHKDNPIAPDVGALIAAYERLEPGDRAHVIRICRRLAAWRRQAFPQ